eukprot:1902493-Pleurochrysis_carterae.AAC.2
MLVRAAGRTPKRRCGQRGWERERWWTRRGARGYGSRLRHVCDCAASVVVSVGVGAHRRLVRRVGREEVLFDEPAEGYVTHAAVVDERRAARHGNESAAVLAAEPAP